MPSPGKLTEQIAGDLLQPFPTGGTGRSTHVQLTDHCPEPPPTHQDTSQGSIHPTMLRLTGFSGPLCAITQSEHLMSFLFILISKLQGEEKCPCSMDLFGLGGVREWGCDTQPYFFFHIFRGKFKCLLKFYSHYITRFKKKKSSIEMMFIYNRI